MAYLASAILTAYMASVAVYKIWYIATAAVFLPCLLLARAGWRTLSGMVAAGKWLWLYYAAVILSALRSLEPEDSRYALFADAVYPFVFVIFYLVGLRCGFDQICNAMRTQVWAAVAVLAFTMEITVADRVGYRTMFVLPYLTPFVVAAIYQGKRLAIVELPLLLLLVVITESRTQVAVAVALAAVSAFAFRRSTLQFLAQSIVLIAACAASAAAAYQFDGPRELINKAIVRATHVPIYDRGLLFDVEIQDNAREHISDLFWLMFPDAGWTGIGYSAFSQFYSGYWRDGLEMSLHSIYQVWWLEMGYLGAIAAAAMVVSFFVRTAPKWSDPTVKAAILGMLGVLMAGFFHQMHQAPMLFVFLGIGLGKITERSAPPDSSQA